MSLTRYRRKRDFRVSPEPAGRKPRARAQLSFVIQKHAATRLHYDFRLELDGVLKSWAVPKGPNLDPAVKALAVEVEDHPLEYGTFEGRIPAGQYGAGDVIVWDRGFWTPEGNPHAGLKSGRLTFELHGEKLHGRWSLVRMHGRQNGDEKRTNWLLIKSHDEFARSGADTDLLSQRPESVASGKVIDEAAAKRARKGGKAEPAKAVRSMSPKKPAGRTNVKLDVRRVAGAKRAAMPFRLAPQLATRVEQPPRGSDWVHEIKFDGYRLLAFKSGSKVRLLTRTGLDWTARFEPVAAAVRHLNINQAIVDGEVVVQDEQGRTSFQALQNQLRDRTSGRLVYYAFDLPYCAGFDLRAAPLLDRKDLLSRLLEGRSAADSSPLQYSVHLSADGDAVLQTACERGLEGIISKRAAAPYESRRSRSWTKTKCGQNQEFVIGGFSEPGGQRTGFGALLLGYYQGSQLRYAGRVGTGFDAALLGALRRRLDQLAQSKCPFEPPPTPPERRGAHWVRPQLVANIQYSELTDDGRLRHPVFHGLREDKPAAEVTLERTTAAPAAPKPTSTARPRQAKSIVQGADRETVVGVAISHPDRIIFSGAQVTKLDLARYYEVVAEYALPHMTNRPLMVRRSPDGATDKGFFQKHWIQTMPATLHGPPLRERTGTAPAITVTDTTGLVTLAQFNALEVHAWGASFAALERPDRMIFDLDPGPEVEWSAVLAAARWLHAALREQKLESFVKTSGGKGLHVMVPLRPAASWEVVAEFSRHMAETLAATAPDRYVTNMSKARRVGRIFIDFHRNGRGATCVSVFSPRSQPAAPVSAPVSWKALNGLESAAAITIGQVAKDVRRFAAAWADYDRVAATQQLS